MLRASGITPKGQLLVFHVETSHRNDGLAQNMLSLAQLDKAGYAMHLKMCFPLLLRCTLSEAWLWCCE